MNPKLARALLVVAVFALLAALSAASVAVAPKEMGPSKGPGTIPAAGDIFWDSFRYYLAWAILAPGILWLGRRVRLTRHRWRAPLLFHLLVPVAGSGVFIAVKILVDAAFGQGWAPLKILGGMWWQVVLLDSLVLPPIYWLLVAGGAGMQFYQEYEAKQLQAAELRRSLAAAELDALRMKLQPDFLFNTLNSIAFLAEEGDTDAVMRVVERLGTLLRLSMETSGRQLVTLEEELALLDEYLGIEEVRFRDRLHVVRRIDDGTRKALVPGLILQPIVENAVRHGLAGRIGASLLEIAARRDGEQLAIAVRDDGPGLPPGWTVASGAGRGLRNVAERLRALYAGASEFEIMNGATGGAVAVMRLPFAESAPDAARSAADGSDPHDHR